MSHRAKAKKDQSQTDLESPANTSRRAFLGTFSGVAAATMAAGAIGLEPLIDTKSAVALASGEPEDFERITMGGNVGLVNPQSGLAFDLEGTDSHQLAMGPPPAVASAERAGEAVEDYWMALLRDVNFTRYGADPLALRAC